VVFVGAFDPMHRAHVQKAAAAARLIRGRCLVIPIAEIPHKPEAADIAVRMAIIRAQLAVLPDVDVVEETPDLHSENYMFALAAEPGDRVFSLVGRDSFNAIAQLTCAADILNSTTPIVAARDGYVLDNFESATRGLASYAALEPLEGSLDECFDLSNPAVEVLGVWQNLTAPQHQLIHAVLGDLTLSSQQLRTTEIAQGADLTAYFADATAAELVGEHYPTRGSRS